MPIGGFNGSDPSPTLAQFQSYVANGEIHYFIAGGGGLGGGGGFGGGGGSDSGTSTAISTWVAADLHRDDGRRRDDLRPVHGCPVSAPATEPRPHGLPLDLDAPALDVVIPVHNEEAGLARSVARVHEHLTRLPYTFRITIADNASTDGTALVAHRLSHEYDEVRAVFLPQKGRGRALKTVWSASRSPVLVYMDVDLSTDLNALLPLVAPLLSGHSDLAIGSRLTRGSRTLRGPKREIISRGYNLLLRGTLRAQFSDAQCGFKAIRSDVARELLPLVEDTEWFFDTELLVLAERAGLRIHEVPGRLGGRPRQPGGHLAHRPRRRTRHRPARLAPCSAAPCRWPRSPSGSAARPPPVRTARPARRSRCSR